jgi:hypothetical protein
VLLRKNIALPIDLYYRSGDNSVTATHRKPQLVTPGKDSSNTSSTQPQRSSKALETRRRNDMSKLYGFGAAIPRDQWIQRTVTTDPAPHIPFTNGIAYSPDTYPPMQKWEKVAWSFVAGFCGTVLVLVDYLG